MLKDNFKIRICQYVLPPLGLPLIMSGGDDSLRRYSSYKWSIRPYIYSEGTGMGLKQILDTESTEPQHNG